MTVFSQLPEVKMNSVNSNSGLLQPEDPAGQHQAGGAEAEAGGEEPGGRQERPRWQAGSPGGVEGHVRLSQRQEHAVPSRSPGCTGQVSLEKQNHFNTGLF